MKPLLFSLLFCLAFSMGGCESPNKMGATDTKISVDSAQAIDYGYMLLGRNRISKYDHIVKKHSRRYGFDWRLISAQIFAESGFREAAESPVGALGLMQIMPKTAKGYGVMPNQLLRPEHNIRLGCFYNHWLYSLWKDKRGAERMLFTFASYNAGRGRVLRAQAKVEERTWETVEEQLPHETRGYVKKIIKRYEQYRKRFL